MKHRGISNRSTKELLSSVWTVCPDPALIQKTATVASDITFHASHFTFKTYYFPNSSLTARPTFPRVYGFLIYFPAPNSWARATSLVWTTRRTLLFLWGGSKFNYNIVVFSWLIQITEIIGHVNSGSVGLLYSKGIIRDEKPHDVCRSLSHLIELGIPVIFFNRHL